MRNSVSSQSNDADLECRKVISAFLEQCAVAILTEESDGQITIGSGTCIRIDEKHLIATAAHVVKSVSPEQIIICSGGRSPIALKNHPRATAIGWRGGDKKDPIDVGWIEVASQDISKLGRIFNPLERLAPFVNYEEAFVTLYGYPAELIDKQRLQENQIRLRPVALHGYTHSSSVWPLYLNTEYDIVVDYPPTAKVIELGGERNLPEAFGFSGGGIWASLCYDGQLWSPTSAKLIAVQHSWKRDQQWVRGTQIQHWLQMIVEDHCDLSDIIEHFLQKNSGLK